MFSLYIENEQAHWLTHDGTVAHGTLGEAADAAAGREVLVLVPAETILLTEVELPPIRQPARRLNAARYTLEDQLAGRVDTLHFAFARKPGSRRAPTPVAVTDHERMQVLTQTLAEAGLDVARVLPDVLALPEPAAGEWQVYALRNRVLARTGRDAGFASEPALWPAMAAGAQQEAERVVLHADSDDASAHLAGVEIAGSPDIERRPAQAADTLIGDLLSNAEERAGLDLLQHDFARTSDFQRWWQPFKATAALAVVCLILLLGTRVVALYQLDNRIEALHQRSLAAFHAAFPYVQNINNLRVQAKLEIARLRSGGSGTSLFALLQATAEVTAPLEGLELQMLQYREGELILSFRGKSVQVLEALRAGFKNQPGVRMTIERANAAAGGVQIRASVRPA